MGDKESWKEGDRVVVRGTITEVRPGHVKIALDSPARGAHQDAWVMSKALRKSIAAQAAADEPEPEPEPVMPPSWHDDLCQEYRSHGRLPCSCSPACRCRACKAVKAHA